MAWQLAPVVLVLSRYRQGKSCELQAIGAIQEDPLSINKVKGTFYLPKMVEDPLELTSTWS